MTDQQHNGNSGAPLKALLALVIFWVIGRIFWEASLSNPATVLTVPGAAAGRPHPVPNIKARDNTRTFLSGFILDQVQPKTRHAFRSSVNKTAAVAKVPRAYFLRTGVPLADGRSIVPAFISASGFALEPSGKSGPRPTQQSMAPSPMRLAPSESTNSRRFSAYMWVYARQDRGRANTDQNLALPPSSGPLLPVAQYGGSQAGAIISYRMRGDHKQGLSVFLRGSAALSTPGQEDIAIGARVKPISAIPVSVYAEQRFAGGFHRNRGAAVYLAGGTGPDRIFEDVAIETYGQAGYVFGSPDSYFFDAAATMQKDLIREGASKVTIGGGFWTGGQRSAERLDVGPRATVHFPVDRVRARISVDWRQRIAGDAVPDSGVAVTLSAGF